MPPPDGDARWAAGAAWQPSAFVYQALMSSPGEQILECEQWLPEPPAQLFPFFADARNLEQITPAFLRFRVLGMSSATVGEGTLIDYRLRLRGVPLRWRSRIEDWQPGRCFVDRQLRGPYALWHHTHLFAPCRGGTLMIDRVRYRLPLGLLGRIVAGRLVAADLDVIFDHRRQRLEEIFSTGGARPAA